MPRRRSRQAGDNGQISPANTMPFIVDAVKAYATVGEICDALREVYGDVHGDGVCVSSLVSGFQPSAFSQTNRTPASGFQTHCLRQLRLPLVEGPKPLSA